MNTEIKLSDAALADAVAALHSHLTKPQLRAQGLNFCEAWPTAKGVLSMIGQAVPGASWAVAILIAIGDAYFARHCAVPARD